jgi:hypothetical protein
MFWLSGLWRRKLLSAVTNVSKQSVTSIFRENHISDTQHNIWMTLFELLHAGRGRKWTNHIGVLRIPFLETHLKIIKHLHSFLFTRQFAVLVRLVHIRYACKFLSSVSYKMTCCYVFTSYKPVTCHNSLNTKCSCASVSKEVQILG